MMNKILTLAHPIRRTVQSVAIAGSWFVLSSNVHAQNLTNDLVSHWPLDVVQGDKTPDTVSGYDMLLKNLTAADLVTGFRGNCFSFANARQTILERVNDPTEDLPINKHPALTISMWVNVAGTGQTDLRVFSEGSTANSDPLFNLGTDSTGASGTLDLFVRQSGWTTINHIRTTGSPFDGQWRFLVFVQQADGERAVYIDGALDSLAIPAKQAGDWRVNTTTIGGILRASESHWVTGLIDDVAVWKRALTTEEIAEVMASGVPDIGGPPQPLEIKSFSVDFATVATGDNAVLRWDASKDATLSITPGVGDVTPISSFGTGSKPVPVSADTTFTLTATRGEETVSATVHVQTLSGVAPNWHLLANFNDLDDGNINGKGRWLNPEGGFTVLSTTDNKVLGYDAGDDLTALPLSSLTVNEGQSATLFFRLHVADASSLVGVNFGLTERPIRFNDDFAGNTGPYLRAERLTGLSTDLMAHNGVGAAYNVASGILAPGVTYDIWIDVENRNSTLGDLYSVQIEEEGSGLQTAIFSGFVSDRDYVTIDPALGAPGPNLTHLFLSAVDPSQGINKMLFDDFYLSTGLNSTVPVPASSFSLPLRIENLTYTVLDGATFTFIAQPGKTYTVNKKVNLNEDWTPMLTEYPTGGGVGDPVTVNDLESAFEAQGFYQIVVETPGAP